MMEAGRTPETSVYFNETAWRYIPEGYITFIFVYGVIYSTQYFIVLRMESIVY
jgi:hypothetical protein